jgi:citrate synthase
MTTLRYLTARQAAERLGVSTYTLYSYVSRGMIRSEPLDDAARTHRYHADDIDALIAQRTLHREPEKVAERASRAALDWGMPVLDSALTLIEGGKLYYRGQDALKLAETETFERVAALLWTENLDMAANFDPPSDAIRRVARVRHVAFDTVALLGRLMVTLTQINDLDSRAFDLDPAHLAVQGGRIMAAMTYALVEVLSNARIAEQLAAAWTLDAARAVPLLDAALILCADHELNASSFAARVAASTDSTLYMAVIAGLAALSGGKHGGATLRSIALLDDLARELDWERHPPKAVDVRYQLLDRLRRGEHLNGFGHRLYPNGDPRAAQMIKLLTAAYPDSRQLEFGLLVSHVGGELINHAPNIDFALALLGFVVRLPKDAPFGLFALGRSAGWIAHAIEQYVAGTLIRARARYVGVMPTLD